MLQSVTAQGSLSSASGGAWPRFLYCSSSCWRSAAARCSRRSRVSSQFCASAWVTLHAGRRACENNMIDQGRQTGTFTDDNLPRPHCCAVAGKVMRVPGWYNGSGIKTLLTTNISCCTDHRSSCKPLNLTQAALPPPAAAEAVAVAVQCC